MPKSSIRSSLNPQPSATGPCFNAGLGNQLGVINPGLTSLGDYGGPTKTHALLSTSPAIDAGTNSVVDDYFAHLDLLDQRGLDRIVDWDGLGGERFDIGAVELAFEETHA